MVRDGGQWQVTELDDTSQVGGARRSAARLAEFAGLPATIAGQLSLVAVELATNLLKHATRGRLFMRLEGSGEAAVVDVISIDHGPGMDLEHCFHDGFSTSGTSGTGLGAVRRAASLFDAYSDARGSVMFARLGTMPGPRRGSIAIPLKGECESGDQWQFLPTPQGWSAVVADGLGHGPMAALASDAAVHAHQRAPGDPGRCIALAHERSRGTRGSACTAIAYDSERGVLVHAGIGNVAAVVVGHEHTRGLASQNGTLGGAYPAVRETRMDVPRKSLVVLHTDGLSARWSVHGFPGLRMRHPQVVAATLFRDAQRPRDDATLLVIEA